MINWKVRIKNEKFWLAFIPAVLVLVETILALFGVVIDLGGFGNKLIAIVQAVFIVLAILGIVNDPTTDGFNDSRLALTYEKPKEDEVEAKAKAKG